MLEKLDTHMQNNDVEPSFYVIYKSELKIDQRPRFKAKI